MPDVYFRPGDPCHLVATVGSDHDHPVPGIRLVALLDPGIGEYWFWPSWNHYPPDIDFLTINLQPGETVYTLIPEFIWPPVNHSLDGILFLSAILDPGMSEIIGEPGDWPWGYGP